MIHIEEHQRLFQLAKGGQLIHLIILIHGADAAGQNDKGVAQHGKKPFALGQIPGAHHPVAGLEQIIPLIQKIRRDGRYLAALSGHAGAIAETARLTKQKMELDEDTKAELDRRQAVLLEHIAEQSEITVTWFQPDERKDGGAYLTATGRLKKLDEIQRVLVLTDRTEIPLDDVAWIRSDHFQEQE